MTADTKENLNSSLNELFVILEHLIASHKDFLSEKDEHDKSFVIAINGKFGSGKTTFLKLFIDYINNQTRPHKKQKHVYRTVFQKSTLPSFSGISNDSEQPVIIIQYDAWKNDDFDDPFISLLGQVCREADINHYQIDDLKSTASEVMKTSGKIVLNTASKMFDNITGIDIQRAAEEYTKLINKINEKIFEEQIKIYNSFETNKDKFKNALAKLGENKDIDKHPVKVILVDELDRCNPIFAVRLLERIKHFFNAENTVFVLTIDKIQIESIIKKVYGDNFDASHYLSRFFDFEIKIPLSSSFSDKIQQKYFLGNDMSIPAVIDFFDMQPREQVKFYRLLKFLNSTERAWKRDVYYLLVGLKLMNSEKLEKLQDIFLNQVRDIDTLIKILNPNKALDNLNIEKTIAENKHPIIISILNLMLLLGAATNQLTRIKSLIETYKENLNKEGTNLSNYFDNMDHEQKSGRSLQPHHLETIINLLMHFN